MEIKLAPGEFLIREKTACESLFIVKEGQLEVYRTNSQGEKISIGMISSGEYAGETALIQGTMHASNVVALTPVTVVQLTKSAIESQLKGMPGWLIALTRGLIARLHKANEMMIRNGIADETLASKISAIIEKYPRPEPENAATTPDEKQKKTAS